MRFISNLMPATGLKIVGTGACLPWCSISSSFQNSLKTSGHRGYEFLEFWCWNLVLFLHDIGFQLLKSLWSPLTPLTGQFSTRTLLRRSHAVVIAALCGFALSCWITQGLPWSRSRLEGNICCSKTFIYLSAFIVPSKTCKLPIPFALMHPHTSGKSRIPGAKYHVIWGRFNPRTWKTTRGKSVKVAQFCGKTTDLATLLLRDSASLRHPFYS